MAQEEEPVAFTQIVTSDGLLTMAHPAAWTVDDEAQAPSLVFMSEDAPDAGVTVVLSFLPGPALEQAFLTGANVEENASLLRDAYIEMFTGTDGELRADIGAVELIPAAGSFPEIASLSIDAADQFGQFFLWEIAPGLYGSAWAFADQDTWPEQQPLVLQMLRSARFIGDPALLTSEGGS